MAILILIFTLYSFFPYPLPYDLSYLEVRDLADHWRKDVSPFACIVEKPGLGAKKHVTIGICFVVKVQEPVYVYS